MMGRVRHVAVDGSNPLDFNRPTKEPWRGAVISVAVNDRTLSADFCELR